MFAGNVGACLRVATNFGLADVRLVTPKCDWQGHEARLYAKGPAFERLKAVRVEDSLQNAIAGCSAVVGFTRRTGELRSATIALGELAGLSSRGVTALVFGREDVGLNASELAFCTHVCTFPTAPEMPSLNLSHAVAVAVSRLYEAKSGENTVAAADAAAAVSMDELQGLLDHWQKLIGEVGILKGGKPERMMIHLRRLLARATMTKTEQGVLRAFLSKVQVALGTRNNRPKRLRE